jgi:hypothetical protein
MPDPGHKIPEGYYPRSSDYPELVAIMAKYGLSILAVADEGFHVYQDERFLAGPYDQLREAALVILIYYMPGFYERALQNMIDGSIDTLRKMFHEEEEMLDPYEWEAEISDVLSTLSQTRVTLGASISRQRAHRGYPIIPGTEDDYDRTEISKG